MVQTLFLDPLPAYSASAAATTTLDEYPWYTLLPLDPRRRATHAILQNPRRGGGIIHESLPTAPQDDQRILWRLDPGQRAHHLHILTPSYPDLSDLAEHAGIPGDPAETWVYDLSDLREGQEWNFRLTANPTLNLRPDRPSTRGKRIPAGPRGQVHWIYRKAAQYGFSLTDTAPLQVLDVTDQSFPGRDEGQQVTIRRVQYAGTLRIEDLDLLEHTLTHGMGRGRNYGCGMLTLHEDPQ